MRNDKLLKATDKKQSKNGDLYMENELNLTILNSSCVTIKIISYENKLEYNYLQCNYKKLQKSKARKRNCNKPKRIYTIIRMLEHLYYKTNH